MSGVATEAKSNHEREGASDFLVVCTRNRPDDLHDAVESVLRCSDAPGHLWVVDSSNASESRRVCEEFAPRAAVVGVSLRYLHTTPGLCHQRNLALRLLPDDAGIVHYIDDDCIAQDGYFASIRQVYRERPSCVGVGTHVSSRIPEPTESTSRRIHGRFLQASYLKAKPRGVTRACATGGGQMPVSSVPEEVEWLIGCSMSFRAETARRYQFDQDRLSGYSAGEDLDFCLRISEEGELILAPHVTILHNESPVSRLTRRQTRAQLLENTHYLVHKFPERFSVGAFWFSVAARVFESAVRRDRTDLLGVTDGVREILRDRGKIPKVTGPPQSVD